MGVQKSLHQHAFDNAGTQLHYGYTLTAVVWFSHLVNTHNPVLRRVCLVQILQLKVLVANFALADTVVPSRLTYAMSTAEAKDPLYSVMI
jgi:hypothetical protein